MRLLRSLAVSLAFLCFNLGGVLFTLLILPVCLRRERAIKVLRLFWQCFSLICQGLGLFRLECARLDRSLRGTLIVANHPTLIDVVLLVAQIPNTLPVARHGLRQNPFFGLVVSKLLLPDDASLLTLAPPLLAKGYNILIFPEGTRSPSNTRLYPFHRGPAQLALRTDAPIAPIRLDVSRRVLAKGQSPLDMGAEPIRYAISSLPLVHPASTPGETLHARAKALTERLHALLEKPQLGPAEDLAPSA